MSTWFKVWEANAPANLHLADGRAIEGKGNLTSKQVCLSGSKDPVWQKAVIF